MMFYIHTYLVLFHKLSIFLKLQLCATSNEISSSPQGLYTMTLTSKQSVVVCVQKLKEFYNDVFPELSHESATPQTYVFYIIVHMLVI